MANVPTFSASGSKATTAAKLDAAIFGVVPENHQLVRQAYDTYLANGRENLAVVKTRGLVSGGGKKPWKQKGTGRARFGSSRNPIWRGGGIVFGPTGNENYSKKLPVTSKRLAIRQALSIAAQNGKISVIENISVTEGKTSEVTSLLKKLNLNRSVLLAVNDLTPELTQATRNLQDLNVTAAKYLNVYSIMNADTILLTSDALKTIQTWLAPVVKPVVASSSSAQTAKEAK